MLLSLESLSLCRQLISVHFYFLCTLLSISSSQSRTLITSLSCSKMFSSLLGAFRIKSKLFNLPPRLFMIHLKPSHVVFSLLPSKSAQSSSQSEGFTSFCMCPALSHLQAFVADGPSAQNAHPRFLIYLNPAISSSPPFSKKTSPYSSA